MAQRSRNSPFQFRDDGCFTRSTAAAAMIAALPLPYVVRAVTPERTLPAAQCRRHVSPTICSADGDRLPADERGQIAPCRISQGLMWRGGVRRAGTDCDAGGRRDAA
ncbi:MAG: hypothetical protein R3D29_11885 [Nitratireductor sp.]